MGEPQLFFHIYNRGVEKRKIFLDNSDYQRFLDDLKEFNSPSPTNSNYTRNGGSTSVTDQLVTIHAYCLMPNHFHLIASAPTKEQISKFMRKLGTGYTMYFNKKCERVGSLFQGRYKSILIESEPYLLQLSKYIHLNPVKANLVSSSEILEYDYSSLSIYAETAQTDIVNPDFILGLLSKDEVYLELLNSDEENTLPMSALIDGG